MEKIIELSNREGEKNYLELMKRVDGSESKTYLLKTEVPYIREGITNKGKKFVDPSGGPMIVEGNSINKCKVKSIDFIKGFGFTITFE